MIVYDDLDHSEPVRIYDRGIQTSQDPEGVYEALVDYRTGDMHAPHVDPSEALRREASHFAECIRAGSTPLTDGTSGLRVVRILEAASRSLMTEGRPVAIDTGFGG